MGAIYHKDLLPVTYVTADMAGEIDSPLYGMFRMVSLLNEQEQAPEQFFIQQPPLPEKGTLKWDGEWQITYETFRDMGAAYSVGVFMIFVLLVAQFRSYILDRKSTRLNSTHVRISYAVFCLKKKKKK